MNKQELNRALSHIHASGDLKKEVLAMKRKSTIDVWKVTRRVAVCATLFIAIVLTAVLWPNESDHGTQLGVVPTVGTTMQPLPTETKGFELVKTVSVLKLYASDKVDATEEELKQYELKDTIDSYKSILVPYTNFGGAAIPFLFRFPSDFFGEAAVEFEVSAEYGHFYTLKDGEIDSYGQTIAIRNNEKLYWMHDSVDEAINTYGNEGRFYADIIIRIGDQIVGYGVIDFILYNPDVEDAWPSFVTDGFTTACFPMIDGQYQEVDREYVLKQIEEYKKWKAELKGV